MFFKYYKRRAELTAKLQTMELELKNKNSEHDMKMREREHELTLKISTMQEDLVRAKKLAKEEHDIKLQEILSLTKLDSEQKIAKITMDHEQKVVKQQTEFDKRLATMEQNHTTLISQLKTTNAEQLSKMQQSESAKYHDMLNKALTDLNEKGSVGSRMTHELSMKVLEMARPGVSESRLLTGDIRGGKGPDTVVLGN